MRKILRIGGRRIRAGERVTLDLPVVRLHTHSELSMPVQVIRGKKDGPNLFVSAAIHGDEINGVEIIRRLLALDFLKDLAGTLIAVPVVNVYGLIHHSRYLPDRRDLNRSFPGSSKGSLTSRLAYLFMQEIVNKCDYGIDLHTGSNSRTNLPQIRAFLDNKETKVLAHAFSAPVILHADLRDGSLRQAVKDKGLPVLLYEAGEALRFDEASIQIGVRGIVSVMQKLKMLSDDTVEAENSFEPLISKSSAWVRASESGILRTQVALGQKVAKGDVLGIVGDPLGDNEVEIVTHISGIVIGHANMPLVYEGEALFHIARFGQSATGEDTLEALQAELDPDEHEHWGV